MTTEQLIKMGYVDNGKGVYVDVKTLTTPAHKVKKLQPGRQLAKVQPLPGLIDRAIPDLNGECGAKIYIKPLSVNDAWRGRRMKSDEYKVYDNALSFLLPKHIDIPNGKLQVTFEWGLSNDGADWDGPIKQTQDIIARRYRFNDKNIMRGIVTKVIVPKGQEYVHFKIEKFN